MSEYNVAIYDAELRGAKAERERIASICEDIAKHGLENADALKKYPGHYSEARAREWSAMHFLELAQILRMETRSEEFEEKARALMAKIEALAAAFDPSKEPGA